MHCIPIIPIPVEGWKNLGNDWPNLSHQREPEPLITKEEESYIFSARFFHVKMRRISLILLI